MSPLNLNENFYTYEELRDFTNNFTDRNIINASAFIETKTKGEYSIVKRKMLYELNKRLFDNNVAVINIQTFLNDIYDKNKDNEITKALATDVMRFLNETWAPITESNWLVLGRWKTELKDFE